MKKIFIVVSLACITTAFFLGYTSEEAQTGQGVHYSYFRTATIFDEALVSAGTVAPIKNISGLLVNHHLLASHFIAEAFFTAREEDPKVVLLLSPNHFDNGKGKVITSLYDWQTPYGLLPVDAKLIAKLQAEGLVSVEEYPFEYEHGISGITPFIKKVFPDAKVVPLIFKESLSVEEATTLADNIAQFLPEDTLIVGSFDFAHYMTSDQADQEDEESLAAIGAYNYNALSDLAIDSHPGLGFLLKLMELEGTHFTLLQHSNAAKLIGDPELSDTTSYIVGYFGK